MNSVRRKVKAPAGLRPGELTGAKATSAAATKLGGWYYRGCTRCGLRYSVNALNQRDICQDCRLADEGLGTGRPQWDTSGDPQGCCRSGSALITAAETLVTYRCGGTTPWWKCPVCSRTHPYDPTR